MDTNNLKDLLIEQQQKSIEEAIKLIEILELKIKVIEGENEILEESLEKRNNNFYLFKESQN